MELRVGLEPTSSDFAGRHLTSRATATQNGGRSEDRTRDGVTRYALAGRCLTTRPTFHDPVRDQNHHSPSISPQMIPFGITATWFPAMDSNHYLSAFKVQRPDLPAKRGSRTGSPPWTRTTIFPHSECGGRTCQLNGDHHCLGVTGGTCTH